MEIFPAIDLKEHAVVRLTQGDYDKVEVYSEAPAEIARQFAAQGARNLHVVDLDGARDGTLANYAAVEAIVQSSGLFVEVGGGIRDEARIARYLEMGADRIILGTVAAGNPDFVAEMVRKYGSKVAVGVDAKEGKVAVKGWLETTTLDSLEFCKRLEQLGVSTVIYTDISRDGAMRGTNLEVYDMLSRTVSMHIMASGGICALEEIDTLREMGLYGAIVGKAIYNGALNLREVLARC